MFLVELPGSILPHYACLYAFCCKLGATWAIAAYIDGSLPVSMYEPLNVGLKKVTRAAASAGLIN